MREQTMTPPTSAMVPKLVTCLKGHCGAVEALAFTPDRKFLVSGGSDGTGRLWEVGSSRPGERAIFRKSGEGFRSLLFSPNSRLLFAGSANGTISMLDVLPQAASEIRVLRGGQGAVNALAISADGKQIAGAGEDRIVRVWEPGASPGSEARVTLPGHTSPIEALAFSSDGQSIASGSQDATARIWAMSRIRASQKLSLTHQGRILALTYSPDGKSLATSVQGKVISVWDLSALKPTIRGELVSPTGGSRLLLFSPDGQTLVSVSENNSVVNWNWRTGQVQMKWELPAAKAISFALTVDGRYLARGLADGSVEVFRVAEKRA